jgi:segregation and condensation protein B
MDLTYFIEPVTMVVSPEQLEQIIEAAFMVAGKPLKINELEKLFDEAEQPSPQAIQTAIQAIRERYSVRGIELREVASGFQLQAKAALSPWLTRLWEERAPRYSRAFLETLALIVYRQPITRAEIEDIRGVTVNSQTMKTLLEREWIRIIGHKEVPGKPALYGTTKTFLDHFNLKNLEELPTLSEIKNMESQEAKLQVQLNLPETQVDEPSISEQETTLSKEETQVE